MKKIVYFLCCFIIYNLCYLYTFSQYECDCDTYVYNGGWTYGEVNAPTEEDGIVTISTESIRNESSEIKNAKGGTTYRCIIQEGGFITIRKGEPSGNAVACGYSPLDWTAS